MAERKEKTIRNLADDILALLDEGGPGAELQMIVPEGSAFRMLAAAELVRPGRVVDTLQTLERPGTGEIQFMTFRPFENKRVSVVAALSKASLAKFAAFKAKMAKH